MKHALSRLSSTPFLHLGSGLGSRLGLSLGLGVALSLSVFLSQPSAVQAAVSAENQEEQTAPGAILMADEDAAPLEVLRDLSALPEPVQRMRRLIEEAARSGNIEALRPLLGSRTSGTQLTYGEIPGDPVAYLRSLSGDKDGYEILAILLEVITSGFVHMQDDEQGDLYVWPYFYGLSLDQLTPQQKVELYTLATQNDYETMEEYGVYNFFRAGITPDGDWVFFVAGD